VKAFRLAVDSALFQIGRALRAAGRVLILFYALPLALPAWRGYNLFNIDPILNSTKGGTMQFTQEELDELLKSPQTLNLAGADLSKADLSRTNLSGAYLNAAKLRYAILTSANLSDVNLSSANLHGAILSGADLSDSNLRGADLSGTKLNNARLHYADLIGANLSGADLSGAVYNAGTKWSDGFDPLAAGAICEV